MGGMEALCGPSLVVGCWFLVVGSKSRQAAGPRLQRRSFPVADGKIADRVGSHRVSACELRCQQPTTNNQQPLHRDPHTRRWHTLVWEHAPALHTALSEDALRYARRKAAEKYRYPDDRLAIADLLERWNLGLGATLAERRMALRLAREESLITPAPDTLLASTDDDGGDGQQRMGPDAAAVGGDDDDDDDGDDGDDGFYAGAFVDA